VPLYEYRCRQCDTVFDARLPMSRLDEPQSCPSGHTDAVRLLSVFMALRPRRRSLRLGLRLPPRLSIRYLP
jgi:putative FmdB family regulatory protein